MARSLEGFVSAPQTAPLLSRLRRFGMFRDIIGSKFESFSTMNPRRVGNSLIHLTVCLLALEHGRLFGQGFGTIVGTVTGPSGAVLPSARIKVTNPETKLPRDVTANGQGYYVVPSLPPARYDISIESAGFATSNRRGVTLLADQIRSEERRVGKECRSRWSPYH